MSRTIYDAECEDHFCAVTKLFTDGGILLTPVQQVNASKSDDLMTGPSRANETWGVLSWAALVGMAPLHSRIL